MLKTVTSHVKPDLLLEILKDIKQASLPLVIIIHRSSEKLRFPKCFDLMKESLRCPFFPYHNIVDQKTLFPPQNS